jgi:hypothetical protein
MKNKKLDVGKELVKRTKHLNEMLEGKMTPEVNVKKELESLDRNNFKDVCELVDKIVDDIMVTSKEFSAGQPDQDKLAENLIQDMMKDYMIDLINSELLDFGKK